MSKSFGGIAISVIVVFLPEILAGLGIGPQTAWGNNLLKAVHVAILVAMSC